MDDSSSDFDDTPMIKLNNNNRNNNNNNNNNNNSNDNNNNNTNNYNYKNECKDNYDNKRKDNNNNGYIALFFDNDDDDTPPDDEKELTTKQINDIFAREQAGLNSMKIGEEPNIVPVYLNIANKILNNPNLMEWFMTIRYDCAKQNGRTLQTKNDANCLVCSTQDKLALLQKLEYDINSSCIKFVSNVLNILEKIWSTFQDHLKMEIKQLLPKILDKIKPWIHDLFYNQVVSYSMNKTLMYV